MTTPVWVALIGGIGIGSIIAKLLDLFIQRRQMRSEHNMWIREKRLEAYSDISSNLLSAISDPDGEWNYYDGLGKASKAIMLADDSKLIDQIWKEHINVKFLMEKLADASFQDQAVRDKLVLDASVKIHGLIRFLRESMMNDPNSEYKVWLKSLKKIS